MLKKRTFLVFIYFISFCISCVDTRKATYFNGLQDSVIKSSLENLEPVIQKNDLLSISVSSLNPDATIIFNSPNSVATQTISSAGNTTIASGYLVDQEGNIQFPVLGNIKAAGISKKELTEKIARTLIEKKLLVNPTISIRYLNFKVTVLGEVNRASVINVPSEKITLLEALGLAGDITIFGKRDNVMVLREEGGDKIIKRLNLNSSEIFKSPYYYLRSNDIVYVEPNKSKIATTGRGQQILPVIFSSLSLAVSLVYVLVR